MSFVTAQMRPEPIFVSSCTFRLDSHLSSGETVTDRQTVFPRYIALSVKNPKNTISLSQKRTVSTPHDDPRVRDDVTCEVTRGGPCTAMNQLHFTALSKVLGNSTVALEITTLSTFYGIRRFITAFKSYRHCYLSRASLVQSTFWHFISLRSTLILSSYLCPGIPESLFRFTGLEHCMGFSCSPCVLHAPPIQFSMIWPP